MKLDKIVSIGSGFKRSINLYADQSDKNILKNYICPPSSEQLLFTMVQHIKQSGQSAFTWTGPYGSGKSSLAIFLSALCSQNSGTYQTAAKKLSKHNKEILNFFLKTQKRTIVPIIGQPEDPIKVFSQVLETTPNVNSILKKLGAMSKESDGVVIFVDEMGKFLEKASLTDEVDVYFFQQIAELANRSRGKIVFVGILHQSFAEYSRKLSKSARDEWIKIQGRFVDLAVNTAGEEQIELIGRAIVSQHKPEKIQPAAKSVTGAVLRNRPIEKKLLEVSLNNCWPLHPITATLLGPVSRKRFGQNQRSVFSFLNSAEPFGFQSFLISSDYSNNIYYTPDLYWDYLQANLENSIIASPDSKMWTVAIEALNKCSVNSTNDIAISVLKTIAVIDLFKGSSGLAVTKDVLRSVFPKQDLSSVLKQLIDLSLIRFNKHLDSYSLFEGSDFNIDEAINDAYTQISDIDFEKLNQVAAFRPIVAKRHYHKTGAMRWMDVQLIPLRSSKSMLKSSQSQSFGTFSILVPQDIKELDEANQLASTFISSSTAPQILGVAKGYKSLFEFSKELIALEWLTKNSTELTGDKIARKEVENRYSLVLSLLSQAIEKTLSETEWFYNSESLNKLTPRKMSSLSSDLADNVFYKTPIIRSEMLNRCKPSGNANAALNALLKRMVSSNGEEDLGIEGFPAEGGLFKILLKETGLYSKNNGNWVFSEPKNNSLNLDELWKFTDNLLIKHKKNYSLKELYKEWRQPPFGIKDGLHAFVLSTYLLTKRGSVALYLNGTYVPELTDLFVDYLIKNTADISLRYVNENQEKKDVFLKIINQLDLANYKNLKITKGSSPLEISRNLVKLVDNLNPWVLRTRTLSSKTTKLRELLKSAHDPNKLIFDDLPNLYELNLHSDIGSKEFANSLNELSEAYTNLLQKLGNLIITELQVGLVTDESIFKLRERAKNVHQTSGDFRIDALAARLSTFTQTEEDIAGIASLAANKPIHDWIDLDVDRALIEIAVLCEGFKKAELYAHIKGKESKRHSIAFLTGLSGKNKVHQASFDVLEDNKNLVNQIKTRISKMVDKEFDDPTLALAAITELSVDYINRINEENLSKEAAA